jgi:cellulose synthase (UDP-forming)
MTAFPTTTAPAPEAPDDPRLRPPAWDPAPVVGTSRRGVLRRPEQRVRLLRLLIVPLAAFYFVWLLQPARVGQPLLYVLLVAAELFNLAQATGFWWTVSAARQRRRTPTAEAGAEVDVLIPVYNEPVDVVEPTVAAATRLRGATVHVHLLDDGDSPAMEALARRHGVGYIRRTEHEGAKAGNINHALARTDAPYVVVFDCDHVPHPAFLERTLGYLRHPEVAFVQTPQYYANADQGGVAAASWSQQALFFGPIARGKDGHGATFCCGTNMVFRRTALEEVGGFPQDSLTEDFQLSIGLHEHGWRSVYVPEVLTSGLAPEDMAAYVSQQHRWARGCLTAVPSALRARLPLRLKLQYLLSAGYFLTGWTLLVYMSLPVIRILTGAQPLAGASADQFLIHFAPYFGIALLAVAVAGAGTYTFSGFALAVACFWIHVHASLKALLRRPGRFVVTPKQGRGGRQPRAVAPALAAAAVLGACVVYGLARDLTPATLNNVAFALLHMSVLLAGAAPALVRRRDARSSDEGPEGRRQPPPPESA